MLIFLTIASDQRHLLPSWKLVHYCRRPRKKWSQSIVLIKISEIRLSILTWRNSYTYIRVILFFRAWRQKIEAWLHENEREKKQNSNISHKTQRRQYSNHRSLENDSGKLQSFWPGLQWCNLHNAINSKVWSCVIRITEMNNGTWWSSSSVCKIIIGNICKWVLAQCSPERKSYL